MPKVYLDIADLIAKFAQIAAIVTGAWWFFFVRRWERRVQFYVDSKVIWVADNGRDALLVIDLVLENKGFVVHRIFNPTLSVHGPDLEKSVLRQSDDFEASFPVVILPKTHVLEERKLNVRPGVSQRITFSIPLTDSPPFVRVTAGFSYDRRNRYVHVARQVIAVRPQRKPSTSAPSSLVNPEAPTSSAPVT